MGLPYCIRSLRKEQHTEKGRIAVRPFSSSLGADCAVSCAMRALGLILLDHEP